MNLSQPFILRPVATSLLMVAILLAGGVAYRFLPVSALPEVDFPTIQVSTLYPGAGPEVIASAITAPLERQFGQIPGLTQMSSTSSGGASGITLRFGLEISLDVAEQEVQAAINAASNLLPADLPMPPLYNKVNPADAPILTLAVTSTSLPVPRLHDLVETRLAPRLSQVSGVGLVAIAGGRRPALRIQANPAALAAVGLSLEDLRTVVGNANVNQAKGSFDGPARAVTLEANDQIYTPADYENLVIATQRGNPLRLKDVARVIEDAENARLGAWADHQAAVVLLVHRQPGANVIDTAGRVKRQLDQLRAGLPAALDLRILMDRTVTIRASVASVHHELLLALGLVVGVIFLFLRSLRATLIPSLAVPLSLVGTFGIMYLIGFSLNNLTLMAMTIAIGFVVDDAIVMIENIARFVEQGEPPLQAALRGARQIGFTILSLTASLVAVLIPLLFMAEVIGRLFHEFAITLAVAILISAAVSLTLTPMLCAYLLKPVNTEAENGFQRRSGQMLDSVITAYGRALNWVLDRQGLTLVVAVLTLVVTLWLYWAIPKGLFPVQDTGALQAITEAPASISFAAMAERQQALAAVILRDPAVTSLSSFTGVDGSNATLNTGRMLIGLKPWGVRQESAPAVMHRLTDAARAVAGITLYLQSVQDLTVEDRITKTQYQFLLSSPNDRELAEWTHRLVARLQREPSLADVASDLQDRGLQAYLAIDRDLAGRLGVTIAAIDNALYDAFGQRLIATLLTQSNQYRVVLEVAPEFRRDAKSLESIYVPGTGGHLVSLSALVHWTERNAPLTLNHVGQFPAATVSFNLAPHHALGEAVSAIEAAINELNLPASVETRFQGAARIFQGSLGHTVFLLLAAIVTVYIVLGVLYESTLHPITILSTLPSAGVGALLALTLSGLDLDIVGVIGLVLLIGIVKKNAILMIDFALDAERQEGKSPREAIFQACLLRFRPILMTTLAALFSALPLMLGSGAGAELRHPLGVSLVGGLLLSQLLTLFTTPVIYLTFDQLVNKTAHPPAKTCEPLAPLH